MSIVKCPVCSKTLFKYEKVYRCINNNSFDISKKGYTNLILANQSFSDSSGDDKEMILARKDFFNLDKYKILKDNLLMLVGKYHKKEKINFLDIACGEGYYTNFLHQKLSQRYSVNTYGIDISKFAIHEANKKKREENLDNIEYFIANLSRLPFLNESLTLLLNCFAPLDEKEFYRVLETNGIYIRVLPGKEHLLGLKEILYDNVYLNERKEESINGLSLKEEIEIGDIISLDSNEEIMNLFKMTPYYYKSGKDAINRIEKMGKLTTKISFLIRVYIKE